MLDSMMRTTYDKLRSDVPELREVYFHAPPAGAETLKPYAVLAAGKDSGESPGSGLWKGFRHLMNIEMYVSQASPAQSPSSDSLLKLTAALNEALDKQLLEDDTIGRFALLSLGPSGTDRVDEERQAAVRTLQYALVSPQPLTEPTPIVSDPWLIALADWTQKRLGREWSVYTGNWPVGAGSPAILWRVVEMSAVPQGTKAVEVRKRASAFFRAADADQEHAALLRLLEGLGASAKLPLAAEEKTYMRATGVQVNTKTVADGYSPSGEGPLSVTLSRRVSEAPADAPLMQFVYYQSHI
ncbi:hypothetical protein J25TS5_49130 [Paenibacillus faecis]|uniref:hypothetical protein n=1 Tax=Paenibacillus faecis TaxID=862114 RepID=UPI001B293F59|nr:hypothetical protein [Paenibacillus faecis]GIO87981.1 hypothetical protein J25TS5_49130 [Paenibacillus faecis]